MAVNFKTGWISWARVVCVTAYLCIIDINALLFLRRWLASDLSLMGVHREKMSLGVEHPPVQRYLGRGLNVTIISYVLLFGLSLNLIPRQFFGISGYLMSIGKEQIKVFEGLPQEERLHHVPGSCVQRVSHLGRKKAHKDWELWLVTQTLAQEIG